MQPNIEITAWTCHFFELLKHPNWGTFYVFGYSLTFPGWTLWGPSGWVGLRLLKLLGQCGRKKHGFPYYILLLYIYLGNHQSRIWSWISSDRFWDRMWNSRLRAEFSPEKIVSLGIFTTQADSTQKSQNYENQMPKGIKRLWVWPEAFAKVDWKFQHKLAPQVFSPISRVFSPVYWFSWSLRNSPELILNMLWIECMNFKFWFPNLWVKRRTLNMILTGAESCLNGYSGLESFSSPTRQ